MPSSSYERVSQVVRQLRNPKGGCPWDLKQTHQSLLKYLLEESYEYIDAVEQGRPDLMKEELGDVLLQILLHGVIAEQEKRFTLDEVCDGLADKLIRRHPHVFHPDGRVLEGGVPAGMTAEGVLEQWQEIKREEKAQWDEPKEEFIGDKLLHAPALTSANNIGKKTGEIKFDWDDHSQVAYKVEEEWQELKEELAPKGGFNQARVEEELGDFLFSIAQLARHLKVDPEKALRKANQKFIRRFKSMDALIQGAGKSVKDMNQKEMDVYWDRAKVNEKKGKA